MLTVTTAMFALGLIALVLQTSLSYQQFAQLFDSSSTSLWSAYRTSVVTAVVATIARIIVSASFDISLLSNYPRNSTYSVRLSARGELPCYGTTIEESWRSSRSS